LGLVSNNLNIVSSAIFVFPEPVGLPTRRF